MLSNGYYWFRVKNATSWRICLIRGGYVHFFGEVSQKIDSEYVVDCIAFGPEINEPEHAEQLQDESHR